VKYNNEEIVYIEYQDGKPFDVKTADKNGYLDHYDFEPDCCDENSLMFLESGSGGKNIQGARYVGEYIDSCCYWMLDGLNITGETNISRIPKPILFNGSENPFDNAREIYESIFCKHCNKYLDGNWCEHLTTTDDDAGDIIYTNGEHHE